jgi:imidazolonepropionase-like amidohydrolase
MSPRSPRARRHAPPPLGSARRSFGGAPAACAWLLAGACASAPTAAPSAPPAPVIGVPNARVDERPVTQRRDAQVRTGTIAIVGASLLLGDGTHVDEGTIVWVDGRIRALGRDVRPPSGARVVDGKGKFVSPGIIDTHSHLGVYAVPSTRATADGNEMTDPTTPYVFSEHAFWPQDPGIERAVVGGVTTIQVLPGSGNVVGGRAVTLKLGSAIEARALRVLDAPNGLKMACGENPKRVYGDSGRQPMSRMGSVSKLRQSFMKARSYRAAQQRFARERADWERARAEAIAAGQAFTRDEPLGPDRDLGSETLADALDGKIKVHVHCYRADEMVLMVALARELGFRIASFHHAVEAYKIADVLAAEGIGASMWADWWGFKLEAWDAIEENISMVAAAGGIAIVHSDSAHGIQRLNQEAAKALAAGRRAGLPLSEDEAIRWLTSNPARVLGIDGRTGSLAAGKDADVVVWDRHPLSIYARAERVFVDGAEVFDRAAPGARWSDFEVGTSIEDVLP